MNMVKPARRATLSFYCTLVSVFFLIIIYLHVHTRKKKVDKRFELLIFTS
jgi:hypothetical protein